MPSAIIGAVGSVAGAVASGKGAKKANKIAAQTADKNRALALGMYNDSVGRYTGDIQRGDNAGTAISALLGLGGDPAAQQKAFQTYRDSTGYQFTLDQGLGAVNSNAYANGMGNSGATLKALQDRGSQVGNTYFNGYLTQLQNVQGVGSNAKSALTGAGQNYVAQGTNANNSQGQAAANNALYQGQLVTNTIGDLSKLGSSQFGSSFK
jgi:hypothetical protein